MSGVAGRGQLFQLDIFISIKLGASNKLSNAVALLHKLRHKIANIIADMHTFAHIFKGTKTDQAEKPLPHPPGSPAWVPTR